MPVLSTSKLLPGTRLFSFLWLVSKPGAELTPTPSLVFLHQLVSSPWRRCKTAYPHFLFESLAVTCSFHSLNILSPIWAPASLTKFWPVLVYRCWVELELTSVDSTSPGSDPFWAGNIFYGLHRRAAFLRPFPGFAAFCGHSLTLSQLITKMRPNSQPLRERQMEGSCPSPQRKASFYSQVKIQQQSAMKIIFFFPQEMKS